jgi:flagellar hook-associated protein 3 FlgL
MVQAISTMSYTIGLRHAISVLRSETAQRQTEMQTGKLADAGLALGASIGKLSIVASDVSRLESIVSSNNLAAARLDVTQASIETVKAGLESLTETIGAGVLTSQSKALAVETARKALAGFTSAFNASLNGEHVFAGTNSSERPFADETGSQAVAEIDAAFLAYFGFAKSDPAAATITAANFQTFLTNQVAPIFNGAVWETSISSASNEPIRARIGLTASDTVSVTANETAVRGAIRASALAAAFIGQPFNQGVIEEVVTSVTELSFEALQQLTDMAARAGMMQSQVSTANERMGRLSGILEKTVSEQVAIDPYESGVRLNELLNTLETTILISQRIQNLSFVKLTR